MSVSAMKQASVLSGLSGILEDEFRKRHTPFHYEKRPVIEPLNPYNIWEHTPLDYYEYGEYPRFIRPVGAHEPRYEVVRVKGSKP
jgi:hypothetical protein